MHNTQVMVSVELFYTVRNGMVIHNELFFEKNISK